MRLGLGLRGRFERAADEVRYFVRNARRPRLFDLSSPERIGCIYREPSDMCATDRVMLYALVRGLRPVNAIEIGTRWGNSARIITNAMQENGFGFLVGIDPETRNLRATKKETHGRFELIQGYSPDAIPHAAARLPGPVDFAFVDGMHIYKAVKEDFLGLLPYLAEEAHILFHDTYHQGIDEAIRQVIRDNRGLFDCGFITRDSNLLNPVSGQGLRLIRKGVVNGPELISEAYRRAGKEPPPFTHELWNYDEYLELLRKSQIKDSASRTVAEPS